MTPFSTDRVKKVIETKLKSPIFIHATDGVRLAYYPFLPTAPQAIIIFYHGAGFWSGSLYQHMAQALSDQHAIGVYLGDVRGHGNSEGPRGDAPSQEQVMRDVATLVDMVALQHPGVPLILGGHSSGAGMVLNFSSRPQNPSLLGYWLVAPFLGPDSGTIRQQVDPEKSFVTKVKVWAFLLNLVSGGYLCAHIPAVFFNYPHWVKEIDPLIVDFNTCAMILARAPRDAKKAFAQLQKPCFMYVGEQDEMLLPERVVAYQELMAKHQVSSVATVVPEADHLSIVLDCVDIFAADLKKIL